MGLVLMSCYLPKKIKKNVKVLRSVDHKHLTYRYPSTMNEVHIWLAFKTIQLCISILFVLVIEASKSSLLAYVIQPISTLLVVPLSWRGEDLDAVLCSPSVVRFIRSPICVSSHALAQLFTSLNSLSISTRPPIQCILLMRPVVIITICRKSYCASFSSDFHSFLSMETQKSMKQTYIVVNQSFSHSVTTFSEGEVVNDFKQSNA